MQICIHRGAKEIGGSCVDLQSSGKRLLLDMGLPLDAESDDKKYIPNIAGLDGGDDSILGIVISHPHMDHFGLLKHVNHAIPVIMGKAARNILIEAAPFLPRHWAIPSSGKNLEDKTSITIGPFRIVPYLVDHSGYDSYSLLIEAEGQRILYSGDIRMHGRKSILTEALIKHPPENIDVLLMEGSSLGRLDADERYPSEADIEHEFVRAFQASKGLCLVHTSAQNIDRVVSIFRACKKSGKKLVIDLYTAVVLEATGNMKIPQSDWDDVVLYIPLTQRVQIKNCQWFDKLKQHSKNRIFIESFQNNYENYVLMFRPLHMRDIENGKVLTNAIYIYSQWEGYWERDSFASVREWLTKHTIPKISIHTSGHASPRDLKRFAEAMNSKRLVPIHTFKPEQYKELFNNVEVHNDGEYWEV